MSVSEASGLVNAPPPYSAESAGTREYYVGATTTMTTPLPPIPAAPAAAAVETASAGETHLYPSSVAHKTSSVFTEELGGDDNVEALDGRLPQHTCTDASGRVARARAYRLRWKCEIAAGVILLLVALGVILGVSLRN